MNSFYWSSPYVLPPLVPRKPRPQPVLEDDGTITYESSHSEGDETPAPPNPKEEENSEEIKEEGTFLTKEDIAKRYGVKEGTVYSWTHLEKIPYHKPNNGYLLFKKEELEEWERRNWYPPADQFNSLGEEGGRNE